jgi:hypothetical protein
VILVPLVLLAQLDNNLANLFLGKISDPHIYAVSELDVTRRVLGFRFKQVKKIVVVPARDDNDESVRSKWR